MDASSANPLQTSARRDHVFPTLTAAQAVRIAAHGRDRQLSSGEILYQSGDKAIPFVVVKKGNIEIVRPSPTGDTLITMLGPGQFSGEANMLSGRRSLVRLRATTHAVGAYFSETASLLSSSRALLTRSRDSALVLLFGFVAVPFLINSLTDPKDILEPGSTRPVRLIRRISEDAAIAEFLKSDFHVPAFRDYHKTLSHIVTNPNFGDPEENAKRRALFYIRHSYLWREIPSDTEWYEVEIKPEDLASVRMFPRAQWRKVASGRFSCLQIADGMRKNEDQLDSAFVTKIRAISRRFDAEDHGLNAVILIGINEAEPLTVIDGNHRLMGALMNSPDAVSKLRFVCGLSPRMTECCWYRTNLFTLFRYAKNVLTHSTRNPAAELARML